MFDDRRFLKQLAGLAGVWLLLWCDWSAWYWLPGWIHGILFTGFAAVAGWWAWKNRRAPVFERLNFGNICCILILGSFKKKLSCLVNIPK